MSGSGRRACVGWDGGGLARPGRVKREARSEFWSCEKRTASYGLGVTGSSARARRATPRGTARPPTPPRPPGSGGLFRAELRDLKLHLDRLDPDQDLGPQLVRHLLGAAGLVHQALHGLFE